MPSYGRISRIYVATTALMSNLSKIIISCKSCGARFYVDSLEIHNNGRFVRCSVCEYEWLVTTQPNKPIAHNIKSIKEPNIISLKKGRAYTYGFAILIIMLVGLYYFDQFKLLNDVRGIQKSWSQDIVIKDVEYEFSDIYETLESLEHYKKFLLITLSVENCANIPKTLEDIQVVALNQNKLQLMQVSVSPYQIIPSSAIFKMTVKLPLDRIIPAYINVTINKKRARDFNLFDQSDRLIKINTSQN